MALAERMGWMRCPSGSSDATALLVPAVLHASPVARKGLDITAAYDESWTDDS